LGGREAQRSRPPKALWVDEIGEPVGAPQRVAEMHGSFRVPTMLRQVDQLARGRLE
jgi:hypothetical protein